MLKQACASTDSQNFLFEAIEELPEAQICCLVEILLEDKTFVNNAKRIKKWQDTFRVS